MLSCPYSSGVHSEPKIGAEETIEDSAPSHALIPHPVLHVWRTVSPVLPLPQSDYVRFIIIQPRLHGTFIRQQKSLGHIYLVLNYMKIKSHKKKQTMKIHESHLLLVNSSGSQVLGFIIFPDIREPGIMGVGCQNSLDSLGQQ